MSKENVSRAFLLPGIELSDKDKILFTQFGFVNTYLTCEPLSYPFEVIFLLFRPSSIDLDFSNYIDRLQQNKNFIEVVDLVHGEILLVYRIPKQFRHDYHLFLEGKYSKLSKDFKKCFSMEKHVIDSTGKPIREDGRFKTVPTNFYHVFNRTQHIKDIFKEKYGIDDDMVSDLEFYERQDEKLETLSIDVSW